MRHKNTYERFLIFTAFAIAFTTIVSCSKQPVTITENDLYEEMVNYSFKLTAEAQSMSNNKTKSEVTESSGQNGVEIDINSLDERFINYIDLYTQADDIQKWDEHKILEMVSKDPSFDDNQKVAFARSLAVGYYAKHTSDVNSTKVTAADCLDEYHKAVKRAAKRAIATLIVGAFEPTCAGELLAISMYLLDLADAQTDYYDCVAGC